MVLVQVKLIIEKNNKNKKEEFVKQKFTNNSKKISIHLIMHIKIELGQSIFYFYLCKIHYWAYILDITMTIYIQYDLENKVIYLLHNMC